MFAPILKHSALKNRDLDSIILERIVKSEIKIIPDQSSLTN